MTHDQEFFGEPVPDVGDEIVVPVVQSATRSTLFPDQVVVLTSEASVELVLLRQELSIKSQRGTVMNRQDDAVQITFTPNHIRHELTDIAHVRLAVAPALDLALTILGQAIQSQGIDYDAVVQRLQTSLVQAK